MSEKEIYNKNEQKANHTISLFLLYFMGLFAIIFIVYSQIYYSHEASYTVDIVALGAFVAVSLFSTLIIFLWGKKTKWLAPWVKYANLFSILVFFSILSIVNTYGLWMGFAIPIILSGRYYSRYFIKKISISSILAYLISFYLGIYWGYKTEYLDLNMITIPQGTVLHIGDSLSGAIFNQTDFSYIDYCLNSAGYMMINLLFLFMAAFFMYTITDNGRELNHKYAEQIEENGRIQSELIVSQLQPHFIFNTLTSVITLCSKRPNEAADMLTDFAKYLRIDLDNASTAAPIPFEKELEHINRYLSIEEQRYEERLQLEMDINERDFLIPALTLQPIIENAITHGIAPKVGGGTVKIISTRTSNRIVIQIIDNGVGFDTSILDEQNKKPSSLQYITQRLNIMVNGTLDITSEKDTGTTVTITLPLN